MRVEIVTDKEILRELYFRRFIDFINFLDNIKTDTIKTYKSGVDAYYIYFGSKQKYLLVYGD